MELRSAMALKTNSHAAAPSAIANDGVSGFGFNIFQGDSRGHPFEGRRLDQALVKSVERGHVRDDNAQSIVCATRRHFGRFARFARRLRPLR
jgi:hypothetical protein